MVQATACDPTVNATADKPTVMALGTLGTGKSTFLNRLSGLDYDSFIAKRSVKSVT